MVYVNNSIIRLAILIATVGIITNSILVNCLGLFNRDKDKCLCYVPREGIYNGLELNRYWKDSKCPLNIYYCARGRHKKPAKLLIDCQNGDVNCFYQPELVKCRCKPKAARKRRTMCGGDNNLIGKHCFDELYYSCEGEFPTVMGLCGMYDVEEGT